MEVRGNLSLAVVFLGWLPIASSMAEAVAMEAPSSQAPDEVLRQCAEALDGRRADSPVFRFCELSCEYFLAGHKDKDGKAKQEIARRLSAALEPDAGKVGALLSAVEAAESQASEEIERIEKMDGVLTPGDRGCPTGKAPIRSTETRSR